MKLILASGSPRRIELLKQITPQFTVMPADAEEKLIQGETPAEAVQRLALEKARTVKDRLEEKADALVLGADTVVAVENEILGKPQDRDDAYRMLKKLSGRVHSVYTGVALLWEQSEVFFFSQSEVEFYQMTEEEIERYLETGEPFGKAGAYAVQGGASLFVRRIQGSYSNIVGLPVAKLYQEMKQQGLLGRLTV